MLFTNTHPTSRSLHDLPPSLVAKPLPGRDPSAKSKATGRKKKEEQEKLKRKYETKQKAGQDDTPRAFRHLMQIQERAKQKQQPATTKTDGAEGGKKKRKRGTEDRKEESTPKKKSGAAGAATAAATDATATAAKSESQAGPKILPGEKLSDFSARVDREMPLSLMKRSEKAPAGDNPKTREQRLTKHDKRLRRLQAQWREDDVKIREREQEEREEREAEMEDQLELWKQWETEAGKTKAKKKAEAQKKKKKNKGNATAAGDDDSDDDYDGADPWAKLNNPERMNRQTNPQDVAQAPPQLTKPREIFKVRGGAKVNVANVPTAMGSLRRREELADERKNIVEEYRRLMAEKRQ